MGYWTDLWAALERDRRLTRGGGMRQHVLSRGGHNRSDEHWSAHYEGCEEVRWGRNRNNNMAIEGERDG